MPDADIPTRRLLCKQTCAAGHCFGFCARLVVAGSFRYGRPFSRPRIEYPLSCAFGPLSANLVPFVPQHRLDVADPFLHLAMQSWRRDLKMRLTSRLLDKNCEKVGRIWRELRPKAGGIPIL